MSFLQSKNAHLLPSLMFLGICLLEFFAILSFNSGHFVYTLDDPYIHLRVAENIARGHYGINLSEYSSPSSSPLWPFLLAPFATFQFAEYAPLLLNILANLGTIAVFAYISRQVIHNEWGASILATGLMLGTNLIGLTFSGMEHSLQVCLAVIIVAGLIVDTQKGKAPWWLLLALVVGPIVRYEGLMVTGVALLYLICRRQYKAAVWCTLISLIFVGSFSWFLLSLGLESLPTSVLIKMVTHTESGNLGVAIFKASLNLDSRTGTILLLSLLLLTPILFDPKCSLPEKLLAGWAILLTGAHLVTAPMTGVSLFLHFDRYDMYIVSIHLLLLLYFYRDTFRHIIDRHNPIWIGCHTTLLLACISQPYLMTTLFTPVASNNIFEQQYQLKNFVQQHYRKPVAVNDLGLMSFRNPQYVLDLWGLGSFEAFSARITENPKVWIHRLATKHHVEAAILYDGWFPIVPENWVKVATLHLSKLRLSPAESYVSFYVVDKDGLPDMQAALHSFQETLPPHVDLKFERIVAHISTTQPIDNSLVMRDRQNSTKSAIDHLKISQHDEQQNLGDLMKTEGQKYSMRVHHDNVRPSRAPYKT